MSSLIQPLRFLHASKPALLVSPRSAAAARFHSSAAATTEAGNSAVGHRYFKVLKNSSSSNTANSNTQQRSYPYTNHASSKAPLSPAASSLFSTTSAAAITTDDVTAQTRSLYRRYCRTVPRLLQQYQIRKTSKPAAIQHIRSHHIQKYIQAQQQSQQSDSPVQMDPRYQQLLLHKAELQLYDLMSGYCTRREVKQLLCGAESVPAVPVSSAEQQGSIVSTVPPTKHQKMLQKHRNQRHVQQQVSYQSQAESGLSAPASTAATVMDQVKQHVTQTSNNLQQLLSSQHTQALVQPQAA